MDAGALSYQLQRSLGSIQGAVYNETTLRRSIPMPSAITRIRTPAKRFRSMAGPIQVLCTVLLTRGYLLHQGPAGGAIAESA